ncbi:MAG: type II toxin-antitoxin system RatA family toxin [Magnetococcales bacterium]|nr:type II toxin-antitoxin system RatA family toxin [Magnetococcales bacterium]
MSRRTSSTKVPYSAQQMYDLVVDMDRYPEFIPWLAKARKYDEKDNQFMSEMTISFKGMRETFKTKDTVIPGKKISISNVSGPFKHLDSEWCFTDSPSGGCTIDFFIDFRFKSRLIEMALGPVFGEASRRMVEAFRNRADAIYKTN